MALQHYCKTKSCQLHISNYPKSSCRFFNFFEERTTHNWNFRQHMILFPFLHRKADAASLFFGNALFRVNLHPSQNEAGTQNLPSERDWKLESLFRPEIKRLMRHCLFMKNISCTGNVSIHCKASLLQLWPCTMIHTTPAQLGLTCLHSKALELSVAL